MPRHKFLESVIMILATVHSLGIAFLLGSRFMLFVGSFKAAGTGGGIGGYAGGVSLNLFALLVVAILVIVVGLGVFLFRR